MSKHAEANRLTEQYLPMAVGMAEEFSAPLRNEAQRRDWVQSAQIAVMTTVRKYLSGQYSRTLTLQSTIYREVRHELVRLSGQFGKEGKFLVPLNEIIGYDGEAEDMRYSTVPRPVSLNPEPGEMRPSSVNCLGQVQGMVFRQCASPSPIHDAYEEECRFFREFNDDLRGRFAALTARRKQRSIEQAERNSLKAAA